MSSRFSALIFLLACLFPRALSAAQALPDFTTTVAPILAKHCVSCHCPEDTNGELLLETFSALMKGGESGKVIVPGKSSESLLVKLIESKEKKMMPPVKRKRLAAVEIAAIRAWIDAGAPAPKEDARIAAAIIPRIEPKVPPQNRIFSLSYAAGTKLIAVGRYGEVELRNPDSLQLIHKLEGHHGNVNALVFSADGTTLISVAGEAGVAGEVKIWKVMDGSLLRTLEGHKDSLYSVALSPDGKTFATGSYDQSVILWETETGNKFRTLTGHNGAVYSLAFRPDGKILASASGDRTVKLWDVKSGNRLDTLSQSLKEVYALAFSPDGKRLVAGGVDSRIRAWQISESGVDGTNPILFSRFAHDGAILRLVYSPGGESLLSCAEDSSVKVWNADKLTEKLAFEIQPDWAAGMAYIGKNSVAIGRLNGSLAIYDAATGKQPKPEISMLEPLGVQRGHLNKLKLTGKNLARLKTIKFSNAKIIGEILPDMHSGDEVWINITPAQDLPRDKYDISVVGESGEQSAMLSFYVDDYPVVNAITIDQSKEPAAPKLITLPASVWGRLKDQGQTDGFDFEARAGQTIVFDVASTSIGSKASPLVTLLGPDGSTLNGRNAAAPNEEPLLAFSIPAGGRYSAHISEAMFAAAKDNGKASHYRIAAGEFPFVTNAFPLSVKAGVDTDVTLLGFNIPPGAKVRVKGTTPGEMELPIDAAQFRTRKTMKTIVDTIPEIVEEEPNDTLEHATRIPVPGSAAGRIFSEPGAGAGGAGKDVDLFKFEARAGQALIIETAAAQRGSPADTKIEVLHADGKPVLRMLLQATRDSYINFRGIDSNNTGVRLKNWEEMELNEYVYMQGEVCRLFRMPQGPDSDMLLYSVGSLRKCYFDTSASAHANDETCYIVDALPPGASVVPNGLPVFPLYFTNDDECGRKLGSDSRVHFTAPEDGTYLVRVTDTRGYGGPDFIYRLVIRESQPGFNVSLQGDNPTVNAGSGKGFVVSAERIDGYDGDIRVEISGVPPGFSVSTPITIQAGHNEAQGTLNAAADAPAPVEANWSKTVATATAIIDGKSIGKPVNSLAKINLGGKPKVYISLEPTKPNDASAANTPAEITIAPGQTVPAWLRVRRNGFNDLLTFSVDNLPHGVIVDNIGLSGVLIEKGVSERQIFFTAAKWVEEQDRLCHAVENQNAKQTSMPVMMKVRKGK